MDRSVSTVEVPAGGRNSPPAGWDAFERSLAAALATLRDEVLVVSTRKGSRYVQFNVRASSGLRAECVSNAYLEEGERLDEAQVAALTALGWSPPTCAPEELASGAGAGRSPNFHRSFPFPVPWEAVARLAVRTLADVLRVEGAALEYKSFDRAGRPVLLPGLRLPETPPAPRPAPPRPSAAPAPVRSLRRRLLAAARTLSGDGTLDFDRDGDVLIPTGNRTVYARPCESPPLVRVFTEVAGHFPGSEEFQRAVHEINARLWLVRLVVANGIVFAAVDLPAAPLQAAHLAHACEALDAVAGNVARELREATGAQLPASSIRRGSPPN